MEHIALVFLFSLSAGLNVSVTRDSGLLSSVVEDRHPLGSRKWEVSSMGGCQSVPTARHSTAVLLCRVRLQKMGYSVFSLSFVTSQRANFQNCAFEHPLEKKIKGNIQGQSVQTEVGDTKFGVLHNIGCSKTNKSLYFCNLSKVKTVFNFFKCSADP